MEKSFPFVKICMTYIYIYIYCALEKSFPFVKVCMTYTPFLQGSQYRTVSVGMAGIYHTGQCTGTGTPSISYKKKYRPYQTRIGEIRLFRPVNGYHPEQKSVDLNAHSDPKMLSINVLVCETRERKV